jgi:hypothetical protein
MSILDLRLPMEVCDAVFESNLEHGEAVEVITASRCRCAALRIVHKLWVG